MTGDTFHTPSYRLGMEIGLQSALCAKNRSEIEACLKQVQRAKERRAPNGEAEWQAWMVELEMQRWERDRHIAAAGKVA